MVTRRLLFGFVSLVVGTIVISGVGGCAIQSETIRDPAVVYSSVHELANASTIIVVGTPQSQTVITKTDGSDDILQTIFGVESVLKQSPELITNNTVIVEQSAAYAPTLVIGSRYLLYLTATDSNSPSSPSFLIVGTTVGEWIANDQAHPELFTQDQRDPTNNLPNALRQETALG